MTAPPQHHEEELQLIESTTTTKKTNMLPESISFSPAGLLYFAYHLGVASVIEPMIQELEDPQSIELIGCSAGALCASILKLQIPYQELLTMIVDVGRRKVANYKGVSLVDEIELHMPRLVKEALGGTEEKNFEDYDKELFQKRVKNLVVGFSHRRTALYKNDKNNKAFCYVDQFRDADDLIAACILSSYVPGATGPVKGKRSKKHGAVARANTIVKEMESLGFIKSYADDKPIHKRQSMVAKASIFGRRPSHKHRESYMDGIFTQPLPAKDHNTVIVCPAYVRHHTNPMLAPRCTCSQTKKRRFWLKALPKELKFYNTTLSVCDCNLDGIKLAVSRSCSDEDVDMLFAQGRDIAKEYFGLE
eukprot:CAMPEP_0119008416 /NCGR_PEP_ID=MMETSP1176-20130426/3678_1 /TAXON_ID=265551 /ORGANISM="Synedropsis recta cf, Strain CCMP1620" /LENGTH=361 /DNA_ID=CAMNT_0006960741 /DNA_START=283 /DNA_END=1368 /DNA_ORIENTATION=-